MKPATLPPSATSRPARRWTAFFGSGAAALALFAGCHSGGSGGSVALVSIAVTPTDPAIARGTMQPFTAMGSYSDGTLQDLTEEVAWTSSDEAVATVSNDVGSNGQALGVEVGGAMITASHAGVSGTTMLTVTAAALVSIAVTPTDPSLARGTTQPLVATGTFTDATTQDLTAQVMWSSTDETVATVSNDAGSSGLATAVEIGSAALSATLGGVSGSTTLTVTPAVLVSIAVTPTDPSIALGTTQPLAATGTFTDATTQDLTTQVLWASSDEAVATVSNDAGTAGLATSVAVGITTISATLAGVSGSTTLTVTAAALVSIEVAPATPSIALGTTQQLSATGTYTDSSTQDLTTQVVWASSDDAVATVSNAAGSQGLATAVAVGSTTISASLAGVSGSTLLTVTAATLVTLEVSPAAPSIALGTTQDFHATGTYTDSSTQDLTTQVGWSSSDDAVATVSNAAGSEGLATGVGAGSARISASLAGISGSTLLTVTAATLVAIEVAPAVPSIARGTNQPFSATGTYTDSSVQDLTAQVAWSSSDTAVATVSSAAGSEGLATGVDAGSTMISASLVGVTGSTTLTVTAATLVSIEVSPATPSIAQGTTQPFHATGTYTDSSAQDLTAQVLWSSSDAAVAAVSNTAGSQGLATGLAVGSATISASLGGVSGSTPLTVTDAVLVSIEVAPFAPTIAAGTQVAFVAIGEFSDETTQDLTAEVTWSSSNGTVAVVSNAAGEKGLATGLTPGTAKISATLAGLSDSSDLLVTAATLVSIAVTPAAPSIPQGTALSFTATGTFSDASTQDLTLLATWGSSDGAVATVSNAEGTQGRARGVGTGSASITATFSGVVGSTTLTVTNAVLVSIAITPANPTLPAGFSLGLTATGTFSDGSMADFTTQATWSSSSTAVATASNALGSQGRATGVAAGTATVTATAQGISGATTVLVTSETLSSLAVTPASSTLQVGETQQMTAIGTFSGGTMLDVTTQVNWSSNNKSVASVNNNTAKGLVTAKKAGNATIKAKKGPRNDTATVTVQ